jgi:hypothetical protein
VAELLLSPADLDQLHIWSMGGGCGPHCHRTGNTSIYHCGCKQCHG